mgnify:CR=1 FL=1
MSEEGGANSVVTIAPLDGLQWSLAPMSEEGKRLALVARLTHCASMEPRSNERGRPAAATRGQATTYSAFRERVAPTTARHQHA